MRQYEYSLVAKLDAPFLDDRTAGFFEYSISFHLLQHRDIRCNLQVALPSDVNHAGIFRRMMHAPASMETYGLAVVHPP